MKIIYTNIDGSLSVLSPSPAWKGTMEELAIKDVPAGLPYEIVEDSAIPTDRTFRNAWALEGKIISHDMEKAKEIKRDQLRAERIPLFAVLDKDVSIASVEALKTGDNSEVLTLEEKRQLLRDAPAMPEIAAAQSVEDLKKIKLII